MSMSFYNGTIVLAAAFSILMIWLSFYPENLNFLEDRISKEEEEEYSIIPDAKTMLTKVILPIARRIAKVNKRSVPKATLDAVALDLKAAGNPYKMKPIEFYNLKYAYAIVFGCVGAYILILLDMPIFLAIFAAIFGMRIPGPWLQKQIQARTEQAEMELPSILDLLSVCMGTGMTLLAALGIICDNNEGLLVDEMKKIKSDVNSGESLERAFYDLTLRLKSKRINLVYQNIKLSEEYGTPIADKLQLMSDTVRNDVFELTKQKAAKAAQFVLAPIVLFIFPATFIVLAGPMIYQMFGK